jgi:hypothetical protein
MRGAARILAGVRVGKAAEAPVAVAYDPAHVPERDMSEGPVGLRLYEELVHEGGLSALTSRLSYAQIQALKAADREDLARIFHGSSYDFLQRLKRDPPERLAAHMLRTLELQRSQAGGTGDAGTFLLFGLLLLND